MTMTIETTTTADRAGQPPPDSASTRIIGVAIIALAAVGLAVFGLVRTDDVAAVAITELEYDIAEDGTRFVFDDAPVFDDGLPAYGNGFVTQGYIYPAGAIETHGAGVNQDGTPTHPDLVVGTWTCEGHMIGDGALSETGAWVVSKQIFDFDDKPGDRQIVTEGLELVDHEVAGLRPIVGGTGEYRSASGEQSQVLHGHNDSEGVQLTVELSVETPTD